MNNVFTWRVLPIVASLVILGGVVTAVLISKKTQDDKPGVVTGSDAMVAFTDAEDFQNYLRESYESANDQNGLSTSAVKEIAADEAALNEGTSDVSTTNTQVAGIDEPDIVKSDGNRLYVSKQYPFIFYNTGILEDIDTSDEKILPPNEDFVEEVAVVNAKDPAAMAVENPITPNGQLLYDDNYLAVIGGQVVKVYNTTATGPKQAWEAGFVNGYYRDARVANGSLYIIVEQSAGIDTPCPYTPFRLASGAELTITCTDILHPIDPTPVNAITTIMKFNLADGTLQAKQSFVASSSYSTTIAMFEDNLYLVHKTYPNEIEFMYTFFNEEVSDLFPADVTNRVREVRNFDISDQSKMTEISIALNNHLQTLDEAARTNLSEQLQQRIDTYVQERIRELDRSVITQVRADDLSIAHTASLPGTVSNQFAIDEFEGNVRVFTNVQANTGFWLAWPNIEPESDLYILNNQLQQTGQITGIAPKETIYASRFIGDKAYLVTFEQIDPFFVFDVSNSAAPKELGQLKLPGYSSYLHPVQTTGERILGVGQDGNATKLTLFDASTPTTPKEVMSLKIDASWTDVNSTHHAFLQLPEQDAVFIPASGTGYIVGYRNDELKVLTKVEGIDAQRAVYINEAIYIIGSEKVVAIQRGGDWKKLGEIVL